LLTSGTVTSADLMAHRLPEGALHRYIPLDHPAWVARFLDHWRPQAALFAESDLWPNLVEAAAKRAIPLGLVNARLSDRSHKRWQSYPHLIRRLAGRFSVTLVQTEQDASRFAGLGFDPVQVTGNIKFAVPAPSTDAQEVAQAQAALKGRPVWLAASTHAGEEAMAARLHAGLKADFPGLLTVIVPRHVYRCEAVEQEIAPLGLRLQRRSDGEWPGPETDLFLGDSMGEMGLYCSLAPVVMMGKSFAKGGGQNPIEPARLESALLWGPSMSNFADIARRMEAAGAARQVSDEAGLGSALRQLLADPAHRSAMAQAGIAFAKGEEAVLDRVFAALDPWWQGPLGLGAE
ncbi:MAG: 3-deoxy-D-manno-octulosonic acid transferase, partial [Rhodospirillaceae bacterium]